MSQVRIAAIIQGNLRTDRIHSIVTLMKSKFDQVVVSCWEGDAERASSLDCEVILNQLPENFGLNNRNLQRVSTAMGLQWAKSRGCTHVLKWRTDMLPTGLDVEKLLAYSSEAPLEYLSGRIVTCCFRNLSVSVDWFSSVPDLFAFGPMDAMELLWGMEGFDASRPYNVPEHMERELGDGWWIGRPVSDITACYSGKPVSDITSYYCPETELYALLRQRVEQQYPTTWNHEKIVRAFFRLIDHREMKICWFGQNGLRSIAQARNYPWWTMANWRGRAPWIVKPGYERTYWWQTIGRWTNQWHIDQELRRQRRWQNSFLNN